MSVEIRDVDRAFGHTGFEDEPAPGLTPMIRSIPHVQLSFSAGVEMFGFVPDAKGFLGLQALCEILRYELCEGEKKRKKEKMKTHNTPQANYFIQMSPY
jgi:hypothetical protein